MNDTKALLEGVASKEVSVEEALLRLKKMPFEEAGFSDLGFAKVDTHRKVRCGFGEVIYGEGKTAKQIAAIAKTLLDKGEKSVLITRMSREAADEAALTVPLHYDEVSRIGVAGEAMKIDAAKGALHSVQGKGGITIATGGTSDLPVAEEAALTAQFFGCDVCRIYDAGVAGLHRLLSRLDDLMSSRVIIAVAGMEGALASVIGGLADCPVIAVPTSAGYGASFGGLSALLSMLNSCASGVSVVNIDNGFGAGYLAAMIERMGE